jgi:hypothetical protein
MAKSECEPSSFGLQILCCLPLSYMWPKNSQHYHLQHTNHKNGHRDWSPSPASSQRSLENRIGQRMQSLPWEPLMASPWCS